MFFEPFGGLLWMALFAVAFVVGLVVIILGRRHRAVISTGCFMMLAPWFLFFLLGLLMPGSEIDEWNPGISSDSFVTGSWQGHDFQIELKVDATYTATMRGRKSQGRWRRDDWNLYLTKAGEQEIYMRFVTGADDELLLLPELPWNYFESNNPGPILRKKMR
jgi:hypothetical protein